MTSQDNSVDMVRLELLLREHFARTDKQLAEFRKDNAEFRALMVKEFNEFTEKVNTRLDAFEEKTSARLDAFEAKVNERFDRLDATVGVMQNDITGLKHDVAGLYHWDYWLLSIILVVFAMPQIVAGVKALFSAIAEGIEGIVSAFRGGRTDGK
ncbi:MAG: hypothetical protein IJS28_06860 [Synergistaceae bacterium]|nr:hypothetical protein [Synergistaceae bacterium]